MGGSPQPKEVAMNPFATLTRQYRKDRNLLLGQVADLVEYSPSFLSQVESGNKPIPDGLVGKLSKAFGLSSREADALQNAAALSAKEYRISIPKDAREQDREMARMLSVGFARMSPLKKERILAILQENEDA